MSDDMNEGFSFQLDDLQPRTWSDAFFWLKGVADAHDGDWWNESIDDLTVQTRQRRLAQISELAMERLTGWAIGQIFPGLPSDVDLLHLDLPVRASNTLARYGCLTGADLAGITVNSMMDWRQVGIGTVDAILRALADVSTSLPTPRIATTSDDGQASHSTIDDMYLPEWVAALMDDLTRVATWNATIGLPSQQLLGSPLPPGTPDEIIKARQRLETLAADDILGTDDLEMDIAGLFEDALRTVDPRAAGILRDRLFADEQTTLEKIGREYGVTRERVRQIEGKARGVMLGFISDGGPLAIVADTARALIGTIRPLADLLRVMPALNTTVASIGRPAWRLLDRLDDAYEIEDGWCVAPTVTAARTITQTQLQELADLYGVVRIEEIDLIETSQPDRITDLTAAWLTHCGYVIDGDYVFTRTQSVQDYGAAVLSAAGSPLSAQEIVDRFVVERSVASLRNAMSQDDRFERVDRDLWALSEWGMEAYAGIRSVIREQVARAGGRADLSDLVEYITGRYTVSANSVVAYAASAPFETRDGVVRLAGTDREIRKSPERTRRLFRRKGGWAYRVRITKDHLRGSGSVAPVAIARILDLQAGQTMQLPSPLGPQTIAWTGIQPSFGTIRRFLMQDDIAADTEAFLVINDDHSFSFEPCRDFIDNPLSDALSLIGAPMTVDCDVARAALVAAIGLPDASPVSSIIGGYRERGDGDIADLLTSVRSYLESGQGPQQSAHGADVDEILDLL